MEMLDATWAYGRILERSKGDIIDSFNFIQSSSLFVNRGYIDQWLATMIPIKGKK